VVWTGPLRRSDRHAGHDLPAVTPIPGVTADDLDWLNRHADLAGGRTRYVLAGGREDRSWLKTTMIRG